MPDADDKISDALMKAVIEYRKARHLRNYLRDRLAEAQAALEKADAVLDQENKKAHNQWESE